MCPICKSDTAKEWRPFCSRRCADIDLGRWMAGQYVVAGDDVDADGSDDGETDDTELRH